MCILHGLRISVVSLYPGNVVVHKNKEVGRKMFTTAKLVTVKTWKWTKCPIIKEYLSVHIVIQMTDITIETRIHRSPKYIVE